MAVPSPWNTRTCGPPPGPAPVTPATGAGAGDDLVHRRPRLDVADGDAHAAVEVGVVREEAGERRAIGAEHVDPRRVALPGADDDLLAVTAVAVELASGDER